MKLTTIKCVKGKNSQTGATLLMIIISMLVMAVLGVAMYTLTYTATLNQVIAQRAARAFYLAESGVRIAAAEYKAAAAANTIRTVMPALHNKEFVLPDNVSKIGVKIYPHFFCSNGNFAANSPSITLHLPGVLPLDEINGNPITLPASGLLKVKDLVRGDWLDETSRPYSSLSVGAFNQTAGTPVTFNFAAGNRFMDAIIPGDEFYIGASTFTTVLPAPVAGGNLTLNYTDLNAAKMFPPQGGTIMIVKGVNPPVSYYTYNMRIIDTAVSRVRFTNMQPITGAPAPNWQFPDSVNDQVYVGRSIGFGSNSQFGE